MATTILTRVTGWVEDVGLLARSGRGEHHPGLRRSVLALREALGAISDAVAIGEPEPAQARQALRDLVSLQRRLRRHFEAEEASGQLDTAVAALPQSHRRAQKLTAQHPELAAELAVILEYARAAQRAPERWEGVCRRFEAFSDAMVAHEQAENEILGRALLEDEGGGD